MRAMAHAAVIPRGRNLETELISLPSPAARLWVYVQAIAGGKMLRSEDDCRLPNQFAMYFFSVG